MRLLGYFRLQVLTINDTKQAVTNELKILRIALGYALEMRPQLLQRDLRAGVTRRQLHRTIYTFEAASRWISFTWAGHTTSNQRVPVATVREQL